MSVIYLFVVRGTNLFMNVDICVYMGRAPFTLLVKVHSPLPLKGFSAPQ